MRISKGGGGTVEEKKYYEIPYQEQQAEAVKPGDSYAQAQKKLFELLDASVQRRLISDVPLGAFLSGGLDSSIIVALAARHTPHLKTFSIGFKDEPYFDETYYANLVAEKYKTDHTAFSLSTGDLLNDLFPALDYLDEPFADSSALAVHILSRETRKHVTVALSGDGADELFGGYNKHRAEYNARHAGFKHRLISLGYPIWKILPQSRNSKYGNLFRQLNRFADGMHRDAAQRYWRWASLMTREESAKLLGQLPVDLDEYEDPAIGLVKTYPWKWFFKRCVTERHETGASRRHAPESGFHEHGQLAGGACAAAGLYRGGFCILIAFFL
jgi:asparagine synthase (glutamine-hydrolysing)